MGSTSKVAIVTGGASGMGLGVVEHLVEKGWNVTVLDLNEEAGNKMATRLGSQIQFVKANVTSFEEQAEAFVQTWEKWQRIDFVYANAGIGDRIDFYKPAEETPNGAPKKPDTLVLDICLYGPVWTSYLALHYFRKNPSKGGKLVMTSSMAGIYPAAPIPLYGAAKHGIVGLVRSLAKRLQQLGEPITVNCVCPGLVPTPLVSQKLVAAYPKEKLTPVSTIVRAIEGFLDDDSITGQAAECSAEEIIYRPVLPFSNEEAEYLVTGKYIADTKMDPEEMLRDSEEKGRQL